MPINIYLLDSFMNNDVIAQIRQKTTNDDKQKQALYQQISLEYSMEYANLVLSAYSAEKLLVQANLSQALQFSKLYLFKAQQLTEYALFDRAEELLNQPYNGLECCVTNLTKQLTVKYLNCYHENILDHLTSSPP
jgi:hypothetical protein